MYITTIADSYVQINYSLSLSLSLCAIRDDMTEYGVLSRADACKLIDLIFFQ